VIFLVSVATNSLSNNTRQTGLENMPTPEAKEQFLSRIEGHKKILYKVAHAYCKSAADRADLIQDMLIQM
jgi:DNA-directed RNA polymerase specialized sigma24 family protein